MNIVAAAGEASETLIGGPCDGLRVKKTGRNILYAGTFGSGVINVYERRDDGRMHFVKSEKGENV